MNKFFILREYKLPQQIITQELKQFHDITAQKYHPKCAFVYSSYSKETSNIILASIEFENMKYNNSHYLSNAVIVFYPTDKITMGSKLEHTAYTFDFVTSYQCANHFDKIQKKFNKLRAFL